MIENKLRKIRLAAMWTAALTGGICSIVISIGGYLANWGPGSGMHPPVWRIWLVAVLSVSISAYVGESLVKIMARLLMAKVLSGLEIALKYFLIVLIASLFAFIISWEVAFLAGKITGAIERLEWIPVLFFTPVMSFMYGIPFCLGIAFVFAIIVFFPIRSFKVN